MNCRCSPWGGSGSAGIDPSDPPAIVGTLFGTPRLYAFAQSQIGASNNQPPRYIWTPPVAVSQFAIGPDGALYNNSTSGGGVVRLPLRASGVLSRYLLAAMPVGSGLGSNVWFAAQSPASGLDAWTLFAKRSTPAAGAMRYNANGAQASTQPAWLVPDIFPTIAIVESAFDAAGNIWIQDSNSQIARYTNLNGPAAAGTADVLLQGSNWPGERDGLAISSAGNLYSSRYVAGGGDIRMLDAATIASLVGLGPQNPAPTAIITSTELVGSESLAFDYNGNLWASSFDNTRLLLFLAGDLLTSGAKTPAVVLTGGGQLGDGNATGPLTIRTFFGTGPVR